jgi:multiple sugar transport system substrate-binding protein
MMTALRGLTWDHPRGRVALEAAAAKWSRDGFEIIWDAQPLEGFESAPIAELAARYDILVLDHPHLGDAIASQCLQPMEEVVGAAVIADVAARAVGPSLTSYQLDGATWALPLDAATQVSARRDDLMPDAPETWAEVMDAAGRQPVALSLAGPHAYLSFASVCQSLGFPLADDPASEIVDQAAGAEALAILRTLAATAPEGSAEQNPIALLERMTSTDDIAFIPLIYGYVNYAAIERRTPVVFGDAPRGTSGCLGSTIGGTGIAVTQRARVTDALREHLVWLLSDDTQSTFVPHHEGQPAMSAAWESDAVNTPVGEFYRRTRATIEASWVRPRMKGFTAAQSVMSQVIREDVLTDASPALTLQLISEIQNRAQERALA